MESSKAFRIGGQPTFNLKQFTHKKSKQKGLPQKPDNNFFFQQKKVEYEKSAPNNLQKLGERAYYEVQTW